MENSRILGADLMKKLKAVLDKHPHVGDIRGKGLFIGIEFVANKKTKEPFDPKLGIAGKLADLALSHPFNISVYPGTGTKDGIKGDHIILAPAYNITVKDVDHIVEVVSAVVNTAFRQCTFYERKSADLKNTYRSMKEKLSKLFFGKKK